MFPEQDAAFCILGSGARTPELCPAGYFCLPGTNFSTEHPCPKGTFGPRTGATSDSDCEPCPAGKEGLGTKKNLRAYVERWRKT